MLKTTTEMVGHGMGDLLSIFIKCPLKKERSDTTREYRAAFKKLCESPTIG